MSKRLLVAALAATALLQAQTPEPQPLSLVHLYKVKPGALGQWNGLIKKHYVPTMTKLMNEGTVFAYGADEDILHAAGAPNYTLWCSVANYGGLEKVIKAYDGMFDSMPPADRERMATLHDADAHLDTVVRPLISGFGKPPKPGLLPYSIMRSNQVKPGKVRDYRKDYETYTKPVLDQLVKEGTVLAYSLDTVLMHTYEPGTLYEFVSVASLADIDKVGKAMDAAGEKMSAEDRSARQKVLTEIIESRTHRDGLMRSVAFAVKQ